MKDIVGQTSGFMPRDMRALIAEAAATLFPSNQIPIDLVDSKEQKQSVRCPTGFESTSSELGSQVLGKESLTNALERSKKRNASALGTPKVCERAMLLHVMLLLWLSLQ